MDWLEEQVSRAAATVTQPTTRVTKPEAKTPLSMLKFSNAVPSMIPEVAAAIDRNRFLSLPPEIRAKVYNYFWARQPVYLGSLPLGYTKLDSANSFGSRRVTPPRNAIAQGATLPTMMVMNPRKRLVFDCGMLFVDKAVRDDFFDTILHELVPIRIQLDDRTSRILQGGVLKDEVQQALNMRYDFLCQSPISRDIIPRVTRIDINVNVERPHAESLGYGISDPVYEELPFINELMQWLECAPLLSQITILIRTWVRWTDSCRLGTNSRWLLQSLDPLMQKYPALRAIALDDRANFQDGRGFCWTVRDSATGAWSLLKSMGDDKLTHDNFYADLARAAIHLG